MGDVASPARDVDAGNRAKLLSPNERTTTESAGKKRFEGDGDNPASISRLALNCTALFLSYCRSARGVPRRVPRTEERRKRWENKLTADENVTS